MVNKKKSRLRRARKTRIKIRSLGKPRLTVHRTLKHIYAQIIIDNQVQAVACSLEKQFRNQYMGNIEGAIIIGKLIAERAQKKGINVVAFDRSGFKYHGRIKALADAVREAGIKC